MIDIHDAALAARVQHRIDHKTKPVGALGRIEALALQLAQMARFDSAGVSVATSV